MHLITASLIARWNLESFISYLHQTFSLSGASVLSQWKQRQQAEVEVGKKKKKTVSACNAFCCAQKARNGWNPLLRTSLEFSKQNLTERFFSNYLKNPKKVSIQVLIEIVNNSSCFPPLITILILFKWVRVTGYKEGLKTRWSWNYTFLRFLHARFWNHQCHSLKGCELFLQGFWIY